MNLDLINNVHELQDRPNNLIPCIHYLQVASPIALFYVNEEDDLMPVAIQLFRNSPSGGHDNPVNMTI